MTTAEAIEKIKHLIDPEPFEPKLTPPCIEALKMAIEALKGRPHGEWIDTGEMEEYWAEEYKCSLCGALSHAHNFCPWCGASMGKKEGEAE